MLAVLTISNTPGLSRWTGVAAEAHLRWRGIGRVFCAKLHHDAGRCIFCEWRARRPTAA